MIKNRFINNKVLIFYEKTINLNVFSYEFK